MIPNVNTNIASGRFVTMAAMRRRRKQQGRICAKHPQAEDIYRWMLEGVKVKEIERRLDPPIKYQTLISERQFLLAQERYNPSSAKIGQPVAQMEIRRMGAPRKGFQMVDAPAPPPELPVAYEPKGLTQVRKRAESAEQFYENQALALHEEQLGFLRRLTTDNENATSAERLAALNNATKLLTSGALERSLGEAASYGNVHRSQSSGGGGHPAVNMNWIVMDRAVTPTNHVLEHKPAPPAIVDAKPAGE